MASCAASPSWRAGFFELRGWSGPDPSVAVPLRNRAGRLAEEADQPMSEETGPEIGGEAADALLGRAEEDSGHDAPERGAEPATRRGAGGAL